MSATKRVWISLGLYLAWIATTLVGARLITDGETSLSEMVSSAIGWHFAVAILLLVVAIVAFKWDDMHFNKPHSLFRMMWFPAIYLVLFGIGIAYLGMPPLSIVAFVALNTLMVGFSEEIMFRGILFRAFEKVMRIWPAILLTSVLFGAVHALNVFITGELTSALLQSVAATMSGLVFIAIMLRTGSIWPAIIYHFLWDCMLFLVSHGAHAAKPEAPSGEPGSTALFGILINLPNLLFALFMLRNISKQYADKAAVKDKTS